MRVLFVEPFYGGSHRSFLDGLVRHSAHDFELLTLAEGEWRQRMRRGSQELAGPARQLAGPFDLLIASDMLDLPAFLALTRPRFAGVPVMVYFHENQVTYPRLKGTKFDSWFGAMNYLSARAADVVAFNSAFHRDDFLGALRMLSTHPNNWLLDDGIEEVAAKSVVLPVGVELGWMDGLPVPVSTPGDPPLILWNHRWAFDKDPGVFARAMLALAANRVPFRLAIAGDPGPNPHTVMDHVRASLGDRVVHFGRADPREQYGSLLHTADIVISTTRHEFFGVGMVEAMYAGCIPVAPRNFNYPALVPESWHDRCLWEGEPGLLALLRGWLRDVRGEDAGRARTDLRAAAARFAWPAVIGTWDAAMERAARGNTGG
jgi:glycosyltransferase involved in cell wall biosynthesis